MTDNIERWQVQDVEWSREKHGEGNPTMYLSVLPDVSDEERAQITEVFTQGGGEEDGL